MGNYYLAVDNRSIQWTSYAGIHGRWKDKLEEVLPFSKWNG